MKKPPKKSERANLDRLATQLATIKLQARAEEGQISLEATATFVARTCEIGAYRVSFGVRHATLYLDHPSFAEERRYRATLKPAAFSESWKARHSKEFAASGEIGLGARFLGLFNARGAVKGAVAKADNSEQTGKAVYPLITPIPGAWRIGTNLGDPRLPAGAQPLGLEDCLDGEYLSGRGEEQADGKESASGRYPLCVLIPVPGGNDPAITATLVAGSGSLQVALERLPDGEGILATVGPKGDNDEALRLRKAFIEICIAHAEDAGTEGVHTDALVSGELYLHHHRIHAPKVSMPPSAATTLQSPEIVGEAK